jgi:uncharacterized membrane protein
MADDSGHEWNRLALERIVLFSDAVIAIAITLLAIEIRLPELQGEEAAELPAALLAVWPRYVGFVISFGAVATYWWLHHRIFRWVRSFDEQLIWLNILFLLCVAFVPFASGVLGEHLGSPSAAIFYASVLALTGLVETGLWVYVSKGHRLIAGDLSARDIRMGTMGGLITPVVFLMSIPLALLSPYMATILWFLIYPLIWLLMRRRARPVGGPSLERRQKSTVPRS